MDFWIVSCPSSRNESPQIEVLVSKHYSVEHSQELTSHGNPYLTELLAFRTHLFRYIVVDSILARHARCGYAQSISYVGATALAYLAFACVLAAGELMQVQSNQLLELARVIFANVATLTQQDRARHHTYSTDT